MGWWDGHVENKSNKTIWALVDDHEGQVYAKKVPPQHRSPNNIDVDAVKPLDVIITINGYSSRWRLGRGNAVTIKDKSNNQNDLEMEGKSCGLLVKTKESDWGRPGRNIRYDVNNSWAIKIE